MKTIASVLVFILAACSGPAPAENATDAGAPAAEAADSGDTGPPAVDCSASATDGGTEVYQGRRVPSFTLTRRGCPITIDYDIQ